MMTLQLRRIDHHRRRQVIGHGRWNLGRAVHQVSGFRRKLTEAGEDMIVGDRRVGIIRNVIHVDFVVKKSI
jgi:hypothetical protein